MPPSRRAYLEKLAEVLNEEIVVCCMAETTEHWADLKGKDSNFYVSDSMGLVIPAALGIALSRPKDRVVAMEGDGVVLMNLGCLVTSAIHAPKNLMVLVFNNDIYEASRGQPLAKAGLR
ncbi:MAG: thiamine pyrophosphate-dependent enzyme [Nitrospinota bacterium]